MPNSLQTLRRRIVSIPVIFLAFVLYVALLPVLALAALVVGRCAGTAGRSRGRSR